MTQFEPVTLNECVELRSGNTPSKSRPEFWGGQFPWVSAKDMKNYWVDSSEDRLTDAGARIATHAPAGTTLLLTRGMTLHNDIPICRISRDSAFNQDVKAVYPKPGVEAEFVPYLLLGNKRKIQGIVDSAGHGTGRLNTDQLLSIPVFRPSPTDQKGIVEIASSLDEKIELNRKQNRTLEAIAQALFKCWFVEFEFPDENGRPYQSSGGTMQPSELGEIPVGWEVRPLDQIATFLNGLALQKFPPEGDEYLPVIKIREMKQGVTSSSDRASAKIDPKYTVDDGEVLFSWSGSLEVDIWCHGKGALNQHLFKVTSEEYPKWFYYLWTKHHLRSFQAVAADKATTMGHIQRSHLTETLTVCPSIEELPGISATFEPLVEKMISNRIEIRTLSGLRDVLLPKLMSGELRVA